MGRGENGTMADVRLAELCAATSLFTDLGTGHPAEHAMRTCLVAMRLADELRFTVFERSDLYFTALSRFLGCTADAHETAAVAGGDERAFYAALAPATMGSRYEQVRGLIGAVAPGAPPARRARRVARALADPSRAERLLSAHCEVGQRLAARMHLGDGVVAALAAANARWDGAGVPALGGEAIPRVMRVAIVARDLVLGSGRDPADLLLRRRGRAYDPTVVDAAIALGVDELTRRPAGDLWDETIAAEPDPVRHVSEEQIGDVLEALADFSDLKLPDLAGHSRGVADLAAGAARALGFGAQRVRRLKHAGLVHDLGRVAVPAGTWMRPGPLDTSQWEQVRLHGYYGERMLSRCPAVADLARSVGAHHERLDGSGYHRGSRAPDLSPEAQLLAAADAYQAMTQPRPYRPALPPDADAGQLAAAVSAGALSRAEVDAVLAATGQRTPVALVARPAGLTSGRWTFSGCWLAATPTDPSARRSGGRRRGDVGFGGCRAQADRGGSQRGGGSALRRDCRLRAGAWQQLPEVLRRTFVRNAPTFSTNRATPAGRPSTSPPSPRRRSRSSSRTHRRADRGSPR